LLEEKRTRCLISLIVEILGMIMMTDSDDDDDNDDDDDDDDDDYDKEV
jgi:hypothetical protein